MENIDQLYIACRRKAFLFAKSYVQDCIVAEDIVADAMMVLIEKKDELNEVRNMQALLFTIVKNKALDYLRHEMMKYDVHQKIQQSAMLDLEFRSSCLESYDTMDIFSNEIREILYKTLDELPEQSRRAFMMSRFDHKPVKEIAALMGISVKGVDYHVSKALKRLRITLSDYLLIGLTIITLFKK